MLVSRDSCMDVAMAMTHARGGSFIFLPASMMAREFLICSFVGERLSCDALTEIGCRSFADGAAGLGASFVFLAGTLAAIAPAFPAARAWVPLKAAMLPLAAVSAVAPGVRLAAA